MNPIPGHLLHARFLRGLQRSPKGAAIRVGSGTVTYEEAYDLALRWAGALTAAPAGRPRAVGVLAGKGVGAYVGVLAALFTGSPVVPLHPELPVSRLRYMLQTSGADVVLADAPGALALRETELSIPVVRTDQDAAPAPARPLDAPRTARPEDVAYLLFTSGSTGRPKGVPLTHANLDHHFRLLDERYDFDRQDVFSQVLELNFDCAIFELFAAWGAGATVCHVPAQAYLDLPSFCAERGISVWFSTPSTIGLVRKMDGLTPGALSGLRWSFFAGEALKCTDVADWQTAAPGSVIENLYGPAELTLTITGHRWSPERSRQLAVNGVVPIGRVYPDHDHVLLAPDGKESPVEGELCISGPQMSPGYLVAKDNEGRFVKRDGRLWYRTGDRVRRLPGGELAYLGRMDSQVQVQGVRVELAEIDEALRACTGVADAVTVARRTGYDRELVAFYTGSAALSPVELTRQLRKILPAAVVPKAFRYLEEFPLNPNRKIDRLRLAAMAAGQLETEEP
ncbi:AMP-binding protein [Streptomyces cinerochromogenes]|uniref:AMP-binding protein n=1 Tax=Streptomyces cinerochromogenes TaxID=66422 RepID=UPI00339FF4DD